MEKKGLIPEVWCARCDKRMEKGLLPRYEYEVGHLLQNVEAFVCPKCGKAFFTEEQAKEMKNRTAEEKEQSFGFERTVTISGKSLVVGVPSELAEHLHIKQGQKVRIFPIAKEGFMVKVGR